jgi:Arc/MetJ-type ribon-helix-helix transcriptional regulator
MIATGDMFAPEEKIQGDNNMATLNISIPDAMRIVIETRVLMGEYQSASDYLRDLIRHAHMLQYTRLESEN